MNTSIFPCLIKKYLFIILASIIFVPIKSHAIIFAPISSINVVENVEEGEGKFDFNYSVNSISSPVTYDQGNFSIQTNQGSGANMLSTIVGTGAYVNIIQTPVEGWQLPEVKCENPNGFSAVSDVPNGIRVLVNPFQSITCTFKNKKTPAKPDPVIVIPGLLGSAQKNGVWLIDPIFHVYDNLLDTLRLNGYVDGKDLFTFPYNWRQSNATSSIELMGKIASVKQICKCEKVDIVAHSMGGLVARSYIQSDKYRQDVDQLIFLGTPHLGAPKAYLAWEAGESLDDISEKIVKKILTSEAKSNGYSDLFTYIRNKPILSFEEILPIYDYLHDGATTTLKLYPELYPKNRYLELLNENKSNLLNSRVKITNFVGNTGTSTLIAIGVEKSTSLPLWEHGVPIKKIGLEYGQGDTTVPIYSAGNIDVDLNIIDSTHTKLPTIAESSIFKKLTNKEATSTVNKSQIKRILHVKIFSPADIVVVAPDGKKVGKDFSTGQEINEIDGSFYSGFETDDEYITIPDPLDGEYKVLAQGTGEGGEYMITGGIISDNAIVDSSFSGVISPFKVIPIDIKIEKENNKIELTPEDRNGPIINISSPISGNDYRRGEVINIIATSTDLESGLLSQKIYFDDRIVATSSIDSFDEHLGEHRLRVLSQDYVGNIASTTVSFRVIATATSTIADVEKLYKVGSIKKIGIKNDIISELKNVVRIEKKIEYVQEKHPNNTTYLKRVEKMTQRIDKILCKELLKEMKKDYRKYMDDRAYQILVEDITWLINN
jgi:pimeloyl-ACP methyl ester carboxylesterase